MKTIYIVMGTTGEYSDRIEWPVIAFEDEELAKQQVEYAKTMADKIYERCLEYNKFPLISAKNSYDPNMKMDYTGTSYFIYETTLWENDLND